MTDENIINSAQEKTDEKADLIGVDPLAWLSDEEKASMQQQATENKSGDANTQSSGSNEQGVIELLPSMTIRDISELLESLNAIDENCKDLVFDAEQVERVDAAALQLFLGYYLFAVNDGKNVAWKNPSETFVNAVTMLGLNETMQLAA